MKHFLCILTLVGLSFLATSCGTVHLYHVVSLEQMQKKPPFEATIENTQITHPFFFWSAADVFMRADNGKRYDLQIFPADKNAVHCAQSLEKGERYSFPQVMVDRVDIANTTELQKHITGTWKVGDIFEMSLAEDASFASRSAGLTNTATSQGTWEVQDGNLIAHITNSSTLGTTNRVNRCTVLRLNDTDLVLSDNVNTITLKRKN